MKKFTLLVLIAFSFCITITAQTSPSTPSSMKEQAQKSLADGKFIEARYLYKKAHEGFAAQKNYPEAIRCGLKADSLFVKENLYKEAFELCRNMDALISEGETQGGKKFYDLRLLVSKERLQMYMKMKSPERAQEQLSIMDDISKQANNDSISEDILYTKANYYFTFGPSEQGTACYRKLIDKYKETGDLQKVTECYKNMVALAEKVNNAPLATSTYKQYVAWTDSVKSLNAAKELAETKQMYENSQKTLQEKEHSLSAKKYTIIALCVLSVILIIGLIMVAIILLRYIRLSSKQKKNIATSNEHNQLKTQFIQNISAQMDPALNTLAQTTTEISGNKEQVEQMQVQIETLRSFSNDIQELSSLENSLDELYELKDTNVNAFCEEVMRKVKPFVSLGVETEVGAHKLQVKINQEHLERVLTYLLRNAAHYTESGRITLEFKKKGAHLHQFIVTDTGPGIPESLRENLFKPFAEIKDLTQGDGLGLPICSLITTKMNGNLTLDTTYTRGSRFIMDLRT